MNKLRSIPRQMWILMLCSFLIPSLPLVDFHLPPGVREMRWFLLLIPAFIFTYHLGLRGAVASSLLADAFILVNERAEAFERDVHPPWEAELIIAVCLLSFLIAVGIGILVNRLNALSDTDSLTGLYNRRYIDRVQVKNRRITVLFVDLDRFKLFNDSLGHSVGDKVLHSVAQRLKEQAGRQGIIARIGGDEFLIIESELNLEKIRKNAAGLIHRLSEPYLVGDHELYLTASIGISQTSYPNQALGEIIAKADIAMYRAKELGKNQFQFYNKQMDADVVERLELENYLHKAIQYQEFALRYQPKFELKTNRLIGMEALIRWRHPIHGLVPPDRFIPIAEETGLILPIGEWVMHEACRQNKAWQEAGFPPLRISVNLSVRQFHQGLVDTVKQAILRTGLAPHWLGLEITESMLLGNIEEAIHILCELKSMGIYLSIDDFGTGFSSLNYLKRLPVDCLKIDKSFIKDILTDASIPKAIISLGHGLNLEVIAEGIEEPEQAAVLKQQNCDQGQGYYYSSPISSVEFEYFMGEHLARTKSG